MGIPAVWKGDVLVEKESIRIGLVVKRQDFNVENYEFTVMYLNGANIEEETYKLSELDKFETTLLMYHPEIYRLDKLEYLNAIKRRNDAPKDAKKLARFLYDFVSADLDRSTKPWKRHDLRKVKP